MKQGIFQMQAYDFPLLHTAGKKIKRQATDQRFELRIAENAFFVNDSGLVRRRQRLKGQKLRNVDRWYL